MGFARVSSTLVCRRAASRLVTTNIRRWRAPRTPTPSTLPRRGGDRPSGGWTAPGSPPGLLRNGEATFYHEITKDGPKRLRARETRHLEDVRVSRRVNRLQEVTLLYVLVCIIAFFSGRDGMVRAARLRR
jgi:hypothetical protein